MSLEGQKFYPGETATAQEILRLANEYRRAACTLETACRRGDPLSQAPYRLLALHATELYVNALLLAAGHPHAAVRGMHHKLGERVAFLDAKLRLRKRTAMHLRSLSDAREYLVSRYDPVAPIKTPPNKLAATLKEVADKVTILIDRSAD